ncbi:MULTISPECIES: hypothetical protein [Pseudomonas]|uniref:Uncharacterized protein n=1 Tax=Pseudomonas citronellolis TaxID=53408 RepID=A0A127MZ44_9PSED|nr:MULTISPECIES: hypothetical protein [Pseudomonas]MCL6691414.1 hypothetical protein [Pseudomonas sp. R3.Fl]NTX89476.1 hypothetical protein [Pseudomonas sp. UMA643]NTY19217.1 hypothetical protein [Pseudomonas sp. UMC3103]NTY24133.1 hypothetical protein [Pseudomonas sp. UMA603]NTY31015.1 hypothetical protein [Pseudomonas sp. UMC3129]NTY56126.1 hypothetical protein [Pseudomonas sp. UMC631]NTY66126.1 hypothetical protein [Pseudomonas sp. UMC3106]NUA34200.1 hypothetical protein [Pseudomonas sp.
MPTLTRRLLWPLAILLLVVCRPAAAAGNELFYLGQRIPDIQRTWTSEDYQQLIDALKKIEETQANSLPRRSGEFTGPIYQRMVSEENFRPQMNIYAPLELRQNEAREVLFKLKELMRLYFDFRAAKQPYGAEALGLMSYSLREQAILFNLTVEFWMTLAQSEQRNPVRLKGMQEAKAAAAMLTSSALDYLDLTAQFERQDLVLYSAELAKQLPELFIHLPGETRGQLLARVQAFADKHPYPEVRENMRELLPVLQGIQADVQRQLAKPAKGAPAPKALDLSPPKE